MDLEFWCPAPFVDARGKDYSLKTIKQHQFYLGRADFGCRITK